jgi:hypothetical protein
MKIKIILLCGWIEEEKQASNKIKEKWRGKINEL